MSVEFLSFLFNRVVLLVPLVSLSSSGLLSVYLCENTGLRGALYVSLLFMSTRKLICLSLKTKKKRNLGSAVV